VGINLRRGEPCRKQKCQALAAFLGVPAMPREVVAACCNPTTIEAGESTRPESGPSSKKAAASCGLPAKIDAKFVGYWSSSPSNEDDEVDEP
jgi:hypothetical protein